MQKTRLATVFRARNAGFIDWASCETASRSLVVRFFNNGSSGVVAEVLLRGQETACQRQSAPDREQAQREIGSDVERSDQQQVGLAK